MFSVDEINEWIRVYKSGDNFDAYEELHSVFKRKLVEAKFRIDRWGIVSTDIIVHSSHKEHVRQELGNKLDKHGHTDSVWGAEIHYSDNIPADIGMMLSLHKGSLQTNSGRSVMLFPMP